jgi:hypothetical protein
VGVSVTPKGFPATDPWEFRLASLGVQTVLWAGFGLLFGHLAERVLEPDGLAARSRRWSPDGVGSAWGAPGGTYDVPCSCCMVPPILFLTRSRCSALALTTQRGPTRYLPP